MTTTAPEVKNQYFETKNELDQYRSLDNHLIKYVKHETYLFKIRKRMSLISGSSLIQCSERNITQYLSTINDNRTEILILKTSYDISPN